MKYIAEVDHRAGEPKAFTFIELESTYEASAALEAFAKGFKLNNVYCVNLLKVKKFDRKYEAYETVKLLQIESDCGCSVHEDTKEIWSTVSKYEIVK